MHDVIKRDKKVIKLKGYCPTSRLQIRVIQKGLNISFYMIIIGYGDLSLVLVVGKS